jgi:hypothetical protein
MVFVWAEASKKKRAKVDAQITSFCKRNRISVQKEIGVWEDILSPFACPEHDLLSPLRKQVGGLAQETANRIRKRIQEEVGVVFGRPGQLTGDIFDPFHFLYLYDLLDTFRMRGKLTKEFYEMTIETAAKYWSIRNVNHARYFFENNPHEQLCGWARQLQIFRICRSPGGHQDQVPDAFSARATFHDERSRTEFLGSLGIVFDRDHPVIFRGHKIRLRLASRNGWHDMWHDIWFNVTSGNSCTDPLTEEDFRIANELDMFFQNLAAKFIDPWDNDNCIIPKFYPEIF